MIRRPHFITPKQNYLCLLRHYQPGNYYRWPTKEPDRSAGLIGENLYRKLIVLLGGVCWRLLNTELA